MTKTDTQNLIHDIIDTWNEQHPIELVYDDNTTDDSVCVYRDDNYELNLQPVDIKLSSTFFNLDTNTVDDYFEFTYGGTSTNQEWIDEIVDFLMGQFDFRIQSYGDTFIPEY
jgi:hypothetical protein